MGLTQSSSQTIAKKKRIKRLLKASENYNNSNNNNNTIVKSTTSNNNNSTHGGHRNNSGLSSSIRRVSIAVANKMFSKSSTSSLKQSSSGSSLTNDNNNNDINNVNNNNNNVNKKNVKIKNASSNKSIVDNKNNNSNSNLKKKRKGKQSIGPPMLSGRTPSFLAKEVQKKARNASFGTRVKLGFFVDNDSKQFISTEDAKRIFNDSLNNSELLSRCSEALKEELFRHVVPVFVKKGDLLYEQGNYGQILYIVVKGELDSRRIDNGETYKHILGPGSAMAEHAILMNSPHEDTVIVNKAGLLLAVHRLQYQMAAMTTGQKARVEKHMQFKHDNNSNIITHENDILGDSHGLVHIPLFAPLTAKQLNLIYKAMERRTFTPGQKIIGAAEPSPGLFIVIDGEVALRTPKALYHNDDEKQQNNDRTENIEEMFNDSAHMEVEWLGQGDYFSEGSLLSGGKQPMGVDAVASSHQVVQCLVLTGEKFIEILGGAKEEGVPILDLIKHVHLVRLLNRNPLFSKLDEDQISKLAKNFELKKYGAGDPIIEAGRPVVETGGMFIVTQGLVKLVPSFNEDLYDYYDLLYEDNESEDELEIIELNKGDDDLTTIRPQSIKDTKRSILMNQSNDVVNGSSFYGFNPNLIGKTRSRSRSGSRGGSKISSPKKNNFASLSEDNNNNNNNNNKKKDNDYAVLLSGDSFGEDAILTDDINDEIVQVASVFAMGGVTCGFLTREVLEDLNVLDLIISSLIEDDDEEDDEDDNNNEKVENNKENRLEKSISSKFLAYESFENINNNKSSKSKRQSIMSLTQVQGNMFKVLRRLHHTELTDVWVALHKPSKQLMVIKGINVGVANKQGLGQYIFAEQTILSQLTSPFVTHLISAWEEQSLVLVGLEPALGGDVEQIMNKILILQNPELFKTIKNSSSNARKSIKNSNNQNIHIPNEDELPELGELGCLPFTFIKFTAACSVLALKHLYEHNICHRDLKPGNMMLDHHGYIKLMDFGIAKQLPAGSSRTYTLCGSPQYMSPELARLALGTGSGYSMSNDWWALGIVLYSMTFGYTPFSNDAIKKRSKFLNNKTDDKKNKKKKDNMKQNKQKRFHQTFSLINDFAKQNKGLDDDIYDIFNKKKDIKDQRWKYLHEFITGLLTPSPLMRLGSTFKGPRLAMSHKLFTESDDHFQVDWEKLRKRKQSPPFKPIKLIVNLDTVSKLASEELNNKADNEFKENVMQSRNVNSSNGTLESNIRGQLEQDTSGFMGTQLLKAERARRQLMMARKQQLKRVAYKGRLLDTKLNKSSTENTLNNNNNNENTANNDTSNRKTLEVQVLHNFTKKEAKHQKLLQSKPKFNKKHINAAINIQKRYRGKMTRRKVYKETGHLFTKLAADIKIKTKTKEWREKARNNSQSSAADRNSVVSTGSNGNKSVMTSNLIGYSMDV